MSWEKSSYTFLSTPSARRATVAPPPLRGVPDISIHALREEGDQRISAAVDAHNISIHALREEGDVPGCEAPRP